MNFKLKSSRDEPSFQILQQLWEKENLPTDLTKFLFCQMTTWVEKKKKKSPKHHEHTFYILATTCMFAMRIYAA